MRGLIRTFTGQWIAPVNPDPKRISAVDIAHHLSLVNRFNGATIEPLNVAQHSWWVSYLVRPYGPAVELQGLLHDASEAYLGDVTKWLKEDQCMDGYRTVEELVHERIMDSFGLPAVLHPAIVEADRVMVIVEGRYGFQDPTWPHVDQYITITEEQRQATRDWEPWDWQTSKQKFLEQFGRVYAKR